MSSARSVIRVTYSLKRAWQLVAEVESACSGIHVLINAAGQRHVRILGMVRLSNAALPLLQRAGGSRLIVNVAPKHAGRKERLFPYGGSVECFQRLVEGIALQLEDSSITVAGVRPVAEDETSRPPASAGLAAIAKAADFETAEQIVTLVASHRPGWRLSRTRPFGPSDVRFWDAPLPTGPVARPRPSAARLRGTSQAPC